MIKEKEIIISDPGDEVEPITVKSELIYCLVVLILVSLMLYGGAKYHPRSKYKTVIEK